MHGHEHVCNSYIGTSSRTYWHPSNGTTPWNLESETRMDIYIGTINSYIDNGAGDIGTTLAGETIVHSVMAAMATLFDAYMCDLVLSTI